uniref:Uncharacterized protein n=1 Tax=Pipistrellus kuhlii TaxID=59472 RepID=A0A7J7VUT5_PIPKU|nr:hypothetical protein mPipKuh1_008256 [Pipistrellus kuhlii]
MKREQRAERCFRNGVVSQGRGRTQEARGKAMRNPPEVGGFRTLSCFWLVCHETQKGSVWVFSPREKLCLPHNTRREGTVSPCTQGSRGPERRDVSQLTPLAGRTRDPGPRSSDSTCDLPTGPWLLLQGEGPL